MSNVATAQISEDSTLVVFSDCTNRFLSQTALSSTFSDPSCALENSVRAPRTRGASTLKTSLRSSDRVLRSSKPTSSSSLSSLSSAGFLNDENDVETKLSSTTRKSHRKPLASGVSLQDEPTPFLPETGKRTYESMLDDGAGSLSVDDDTTVPSTRRSLRNPTASGRNALAKSSPVRSLSGKRTHESAFEATSLGSAKSRRIHLNEDPLPYSQARVSLVSSPSGPSEPSSQDRIDKTSNSLPSLLPSISTRTHLERIPSSSSATSLRRSARHRSALPAPPEDEYFPTGPLDLEYDYYLAREELPAATIRAAYALGYEPPLRLQSSVGIWKPTLKMILDAKFPDVERARKRVNDADAKLQAYLSK